MWKIALKNLETLIVFMWYFIIGGGGGFVVPLDVLLKAYCILT